MMGPEIDVAALSQLSSENLRVLLRKIPGTKDLIIQQSLMKPLDKFAAMSLIKSCGVDRVFRLEKTAPGKLVPILEIVKAATDRRCKIAQYSRCQTI